MTIFLDEFRWENWPAELLNKIMDKWTFQLPCRYQNKQALWTRVIICSNQDPTGWYPNDDRTIRDSVRRRLGSNCRHVTSREADILELPPNPNFDESGQMIYGDTDPGLINHFDHFGPFSLISSNIFMNASKACAFVESKQNCCEKTQVQCVNTAEVQQANNAVRIVQTASCAHVHEDRLPSHTSRR